MLSLEYRATEYTILNTRLCISYLTELTSLASVYPNCLQTTPAMDKGNRGLQTAPHWLFRNTSNLPLDVYEPSTSLTAPLYSKKSFATTHTHTHTYM